MNTEEAHRRAEALFKKEQQVREGQQAMAEYQAEPQAMRDKTARLRALRLARDPQIKRNRRPERPSLRSVRREFDRLHDRGVIILGLVDPSGHIRIRLAGADKRTTDSERSRFSAYTHALAMIDGRRKMMPTIR